MKLAARRTQNLKPYTTDLQYLHKSGIRMVHRQMNYAIGGTAYGLTQGMH